MYQNDHTVDLECNKITKQSKTRTGRSIEMSSVCRKNRTVVAIIFMVTFLCIWMTIGPEKIFQYRSPNTKDEHRSRIWISSSVCWSGNTKFHGKSNFPYLLATKLSTRLLQLKMKPLVSSLVQIIYQPKDENSSNLSDYAQELRNIGNTVELVPTRMNMSCSLKSQLQRMLAFRLPYIDGNDLVVTTDVDTFIADPEIFQPLENRLYRTWIFQYSHTLKSGQTFPMTFIAMSAKDWQYILKGVTDSEELLKAYDWLITGRKISWGFDQLIVSHAILKYKLCSLPHTHNLWKTVQLETLKMPFNDSNICFHGSNYTDCHKNYEHKGCKRWHFTPDQKPEDLYRVFNTIVANRHNNL